ncbi:MAG: hypothetical protein ACM3QW_08675 [Ignavibacteriales bacterium]
MIDFYNMIGIALAWWLAILWSPWVPEPSPATVSPVRKKFVDKTIPREPFDPRASWDRIND